MKVEVGSEVFLVKLVESDIDALGRCRVNQVFLRNFCDSKFFER